MYIDDSPIKDISDDILDRGRFADNLAKSILGWNNSESLVLSLNGKWGSGKSSILNFVKNKLVDDQSIVSLEFNPWIFSGSDLTQHFFEEVAKQLQMNKYQDLAKLFRKVAKLLDFKAEESLLGKVIEKAPLVLTLLGGIAYSQFVSAEVLVNIKAILAALVVAALIYTGLSIIATHLANFIAPEGKKTLLELKKEIGDKITAKKKKLVIFIDDIDRLDAGQIKEIIKLIKANLDFPHTIFLLAYDKQVVADALEKEGWYDARSYLDKIIQVSFDVPDANMAKVYNLLTRKIDSIIEQLPDISRNFQQEYWANVYNSGLRGMFSNIRDVKRFLNTFEFNFNIFCVNGVLNVNIIDLITLEAIRLKHPKFYDFIRTHKSLFTTTESSYTSDYSHRAREERKAQIQKALQEHKVEHLKELLGRIFPQAEGLLGNSTYGNEWQKGWAKELRVCSSEYFDQYFTLIPGGSSDEVNMYEVLNLIDLTKQPDLLSALVDRYNQEGRLASLLYRFENHLGDVEMQDAAQQDNLISQLFEISNDFGGRGIWAMGPNVEASTLRVTYHYLKKDKENRFKRLSKLIRASSSWYAPIYFAFIIGQDSTREEKLFTEEQIKKLQNLAVNKVKDISPDELIKNPNFIFLLYRLKQLNRKKKIATIINHFTSNNTRLLRLINAFKAESHSSVIGDHYETVREEININSLAEFVNIDEVADRISKMRKTKVNQDLIALFEKSYRDRNKSILDKKLEEAKDQVND